MEPPSSYQQKFPTPSLDRTWCMNLRFGKTINMDSPNPTSKQANPKARGQSATYATALTTPTKVTSQQLSLVTASPSNVSSSSLTRHKERQLIVMTTDCN